MNPSPPAGFDALIHTFRGRRVMLDADLARIYGVSTKRLNEQVRRNRRRFPADFMLELTKEEALFLRSQLATLKGSGRHRKYRPLAFTQEGVAMLSSVLRSPRAVRANIAIMRAFVRYREALSLDRDLAVMLKELRERVDRHDGQIGALIDAIQGAIESKPAERKRFGFNPGL